MGGEVTLGRRSVWKVFGSPTVAVASDIYRAGPSVAHQLHAGRRKRYQVKDNSSHMVRRETQRCLNGPAPYQVN